MDVYSGRSMLMPTMRSNNVSGSTSAPSRQLSLPQPPAGGLTSRAGASSTFPPQRPAPPPSGAPPIYRPRPVLGTGVQPKPVGPALLETRPAPPVYRPGPVPGMGVQPKPVRPVPLETRPAPPVFNPFPTSHPSVGLLKPTASVRATAPAIYHPAQDSTLQSKTRPGASAQLVQLMNGSKTSPPYGNVREAAPRPYRKSKKRGQGVSKANVRAHKEGETFSVGSVRVTGYNEYHVAGTEWTSPYDIKHARGKTKQTRELLDAAVEAINNGEAIFRSTNGRNDYVEVDGYLYGVHRQVDPTTRKRPIFPAGPVQSGEKEATNEGTPPD
jgi:hypothetical protein